MDPAAPPPPATAPRPPVDRRRTGLRVLVGLGASGAYLVYLFIATIVLWATGQIWGVPAVALAFLVLVVPAGVAALALRNRVVPHAVAVVLFGFAAVGAGLATVAIAWSTAVPADVLAAHLDEVGVPDGFELADEDRDDGGNCVDVCPRTCREYRVAGDPDEAVARIADRFTAAGYDLHRSRTRPAYDGRLEDKQVDIDAVNRRRAGDAGDERVVEICLEGR